jgi:hypothetical protein
VEESVTYQALFRRGYEEGYEVGLRLGAIDGCRWFLLVMGRKKFDVPGADVLKAVAEIFDLDRLRSLCLKVLDVSSWQELLAEP